MHAADRTGHDGPDRGGAAAASWSVSGAVLAGGSSRRMQQDKRYLDIAGAPLLVRAVTSVGAVCDEVVVVTSSDDDRADARPLVADRPWIVDGRPGEGPLAGVEAALRAATTDAVVVVAGDHPDVAPTVLALLVDRLAASPDADAAMLATDRGPQPLVAVYRASTLAAISALLDGGERRARSLTEHLEVAIVDGPTWRAADPSGGSAVDLDTPQDVAARRHAARADRTRSTGAP